MTEPVSFYHQLGNSWEPRLLACQLACTLASWGPRLCNLVVAACVVKWWQWSGLSAAILGAVAVGVASCGEHSGWPVGLEWVVGERPPARGQ